MSPSCAPRSSLLVLRHAKRRWPVPNRRWSRQLEIHCQSEVPMNISIEAPESPIEHMIIPSVRDLGDGFKVRRALPSLQRRMVGPFIFLDHFGPIVFGAGAGANIR